MTSSSDHDAPASALVRLLHQFSAVEDLLVLVTVPESDSSDANASRLTAYAERFEAAVQ